MALFEPPAPALLPLLPRLGFSARLRWELSDTYLTTSTDASSSPSAHFALSSTTDRKTSALFYFLSNQSLSTTPSLTAVLAKPTSSPDFLFLAVHPNPHLTQTPTLLKLSFHPPSTPTRSLISLQTLLPTRALLSLSTPPHATSTASLSKRELFHLEFNPNSIAAGFAIPPDFIVRYLQPTQALSHAILQLGVRIRFRSFHSRVLRKDSIAGGIIPIVQDGPNTRVDETHDKELIVTPHRVDRPDPTGLDDFFIFKEIDTGLALSLHPENPQLSRTKTLKETALVLVAEKSAEPIRVRYSTQGWGRVHLGCGQGDDFVHWLMAGRGGRLELRRHSSRWETFQIEFVRQSLEMGVKELPESPLVRIANEETKRVTRMEIEARVQKAREREGQNGATVKRGGFDHGRALAGLSGEPQKVRRTVPNVSEVIGNSDDGKNKRGHAEAKAKAKTVSKGALKGAAVAAAATAPSLPRNQANRKAAKRNKKKKQRQKAKNAANALSSTASPVSGNSTSAVKPEQKQKVSESDVRSKVEKPEANDENSITETSKKAELNKKSGPPCAACGRPLEGTYITALGKRFHPGCFCCGRCRRPLGASAGNFRERGGVPYCDSCYAAHLAPRCARCSQPIMDTVVTAMDKQWHKSCLTCTICGLPLTQTFWLYADKPNEPRCSRCVTGSEEYSGPQRPNSRMVNLPLFGQPSGTGVPMTSPNLVNGPRQGGRARLLHPVPPGASRR